MEAVTLDTQKLFNWSFKTCAIYFPFSLLRKTQEDTAIVETNNETLQLSLTGVTSTSTDSTSLAAITSFNMQSSNVPDVDVSTQLSTATPTTSLNEPATDATMSTAEEETTVSMTTERATTPTSSTTTTSTSTPATTEVFTDPVSTFSTSIPTQMLTTEGRAFLPRTKLLSRRSQCRRRPWECTTYSTTTGGTEWTESTTPYGRSSTHYSSTIGTLTVLVFVFLFHFNIFIVCLAGKNKCRERNWWNCLLLEFSTTTPEEAATTSTTTSTTSTSTESTSSTSTTTDTQSMADQIRLTNSSPAISKGMI
ncbi:hypothetical protein EB796_014943 [Bugula neritina]|uniref:Uncharacterized protein n=1 Tax=Bugula neritina TaxID=10212 RepID=A0A7J7JM77_BUGNE|nr:hypothetical protein EB796_014943 [Bugula neritina]